ncbi:hypothetical protein MITS9508_00119 [Synechococcus sp. MIT S9508]|nr:hypothetical protein MITS9508_00119 [Synechococcus sp. MIT S9508]
MHLKGCGLGRLQLSLLSLSCDQASVIRNLLHAQLRSGQVQLHSVQHISVVMAKGYWISTGTIHTPLAMVPYISRLTEWLPTVGAKFLVRDVQCDVREGTPGSLNVIIEFPSLQSAVSAYESTDYQSLIELRTPHSDLTLSISEELTA